MKRHVALSLVFGLLAFAIPGIGHAEPKLATLNVKGMVCES